MSADIPEDVREFLLSSGLDDRKLDIIKFNIVNYFSNPKSVADIISRRYPRLLNGNVIPDSNPISMKIENWKILNRTLALLKCELDDEKIKNLANKRSISRDDIFNFLLLLRVKLDAYEPQYFARFGLYLKNTSMNTSTRSMSLSPRAMNITQSDEIPMAGMPSNDIDFNSFDILENIKSVGATAKANGMPIKGTLFNTSVDVPVSKLLETGKSLSVKYKDETPPIMSEEEMATKFRTYSTFLKQSYAALTKHVDALQERSEKLDNHLMDIRKQNKEDLNKTDLRIKLINQELEEFHRPTSRDAAIMATYNPSSSQKLGTSRRI